LEFLLDFFGFLLDFLSDFSWISLDRLRILVKFRIFSGFLRIFLGFSWIAFGSSSSFGLLVEFLSDFLNFLGPLPDLSQAPGRIGFLLDFLTFLSYL